MRIKFEGEFGENIYANIHIMLFSIIIKTFRIPSDPDKKKKKKKKKCKKKVKLKGVEVVKVLLKSSKNSKIEYISFKSDLGLGDAAATALTTGLIYTITGAFIGYLSDHFEIKKAKLNINPNYNRVVIKLFAECILNLNIVNIITAAIRLLKLYFKKRKEKCYVRTSN